MQEIARGVYIDDTFCGVTLGAISLPHGLILIDAPPRTEDVRSWRSALLNLGGGIDRLLINLDAHYDRTLGARAMECTVVAHEKTAHVFRNRPTTFKPQSTDTGAEWELCNGLGSIRWAPPEITFSHQLRVHWGDTPLLLDHRPGPHPGAIWVTYPEVMIAFIGDAVVPGQPPFLASADIPAWIETLQALLAREYRDYLILSGRGGLVPVQEVRRQITFLERAGRMLEELAAEKAPVEATEALVPRLLKGFQIPAGREAHLANRLRHGLSRYYTRHYRPTSGEVEE